ncbi:MAG TPA: flagellin [Fimbriimonadaceae bacterium]|nr:flagellin [Fimbriimonadaceae bacterium]
MSFRVNTNVSAMNALRNVGATGSEFAKSITKLSTGLRINSAADDPAGLIISENFRAQIAGIDQAIRNNQDAVNFAKTAEGALDEVNRLLRDARSLAVAAGNTGTLSSTQIQANQSQLNSIVASISRIAEQTQYGTKKLLDGSAGVQASVTSSANVGSMYFGGSFNSAAITTSSLVTVTVSTAATRASLTGSVTFAAATTTVSAGTFAINGRSFTTSSSMTAQDVVNMINDASGSTGVSADFAAGAGITLKAVNFGSVGNFSLSDANGVLNTAGTTAATGTDAIASITIDANGSTAGGLATVTFTGGRNGSNGLVLSDSAGNTLSLTETGNATTAAFTAGNLSVGSSSFQVGANANQTANLSLANFAASELGKNIVSGKNLSNIDITTSSGATDALQVLDGAISEIARARGEIGSFQRNVIDSNIRALGVARENLSATESSIRDTDIANEMTNFTRLQILQQSGLAVLAQANSSPQSVLSLLG